MIIIKNLCNRKWTLPERNQTDGRGVEDIPISEKKNPGISRFLTSPLEIADKTKQASPLEILQNGVRSFRNLKAKNQDSWEFYMIFLEFVRRYIESQLFLS